MLTINWDSGERVGKEKNMIEDSKSFDLGTRAGKKALMNLMAAERSGQRGEDIQDEINKVWDQKSKADKSREDKDGLPVYKQGPVIKK